MNLLQILASDGDEWNQTRVYFAGSAAVIVQAIRARHVKELLSRHDVWPGHFSWTKVVLSFNPKKEGFNIEFFHRYLSDGELLESAGVLPVSTSSGMDMTSTSSPQRTYYVWKDPPQTHLSGYEYPTEGSSSPVRHTTYASQVNYYLQQQQQQQQLQLQSGGPRTTPSGYPGMF